MDAKGVEIGGVALARLTANARVVNGEGQVRAAFAGRRGANFEFVTLADVSKDQIRLTGQGNIDRQVLVLNQSCRPHALGRWLGAGSDKSYLFRWIGDSFGPKRLGA